MSSPPLTRITIIGATGRMGSSFATELLKTGKHHVTVLTRAESTGTLPAGVHTVPVDYSSEASIEAALKDTQFLVVTLGVSVPNALQERIVEAAIKAGVPYIMPNVYGPEIMGTALESEPVYAEHPPLLRRLTAAGPGLTYVQMVCGFWYEWNIALGEPWFGFDVKNRSVTFFDDGKLKISVSTWEQCGRALAALLSLPETRQDAGPSLADWKNRTLRIASFLVSQRDMLDSLHRVLGTTDEDWKIDYEGVDERYKRGMKNMQKGGIAARVTALCVTSFRKNGEGNYHKNGLANEVLGLPEEDLDTCTKKAVEMVESGYNPFGRV